MRFSKQISNFKPLFPNAHKIIPTETKCFFCATLQCLINYYESSNKYMPKLNNRNSRKRWMWCKMWSKLKIKTPERSRRYSVIFVVNFDRISDLSQLVLLLMNLNRSMIIEKASFRIIFYNIPKLQEKLLDLNLLIILRLETKGWK